MPSFSYSSSSYSSSSTTTNGETQSSSHSHETYSTPQGRGERTSTRENDGPEIVSERHYAPDGQPLTISGNAGESQQGRIEDVTAAEEEQAANDRKYEERIEDEYAKREGGA